MLFLKETLLNSCFPNPMSNLSFMLECPIFSTGAIFEVFLSFQNLVWVFIFQFSAIWQLHCLRINVFCFSRVSSSENSRLETKHLCFSQISYSSTFLSPFLLLHSFHFPFTSVYFVCYSELYFVY